MALRPGLETRSGWRLRHVTTPIRLAAILLLAVWIGPVSFAQTDAWQLLKWAGAPESASANVQVIPAGQALVLAPGTMLTLSLADGSVVGGRFLGRTLLDSTLYASRFATYARTSDFVPFALGETLSVTLRDGREWRAPFVGYGEMTVLLANPGGAGVWRVPFEFAKEFRGAHGAWVQPKALARAFHKSSLPSAEALALGDRGAVPGAPEAWDAALRVAVQDIKSASVDLPSGGSAAGAVVVGVVAAVVLFYVLLGASQHSTSNTSCESAQIPNVLGGMSVRLTTQPYDLSRSCYAGDPVAVAEVWPGEPVTPHVGTTPESPVATSAAPRSPTPFAIPVDVNP